MHMRMELKAQDEKTAEGLRILARIIDRGGVVDTAGPMNTDGVVDVYANYVDASATDRLIESLTDMTHEDWTGDSGMEHRTYSGMLFGRRLNIITTTD